MMIKGGIRIGGLGISGYDADAAAYFERAGVTDATAKGQINAFVKGVKDLGLYNSMVSWPLRSAQNAGTGTTAYSLGGLGIFNGTLTNGPTWGADGISNAGTSYISLANAFPETRVMIQVHKLTDGSDLDGATMASYGSGPEKGYEFLHVLSGIPQWRVYAGDFLNNARTSSVNLNDSQFHFVAGITDNASSGIIVDATAGSFTTMTNLPRLTATGILTIGARSNGTAVIPCQTSFAAIFTTYTSEVSSVRTLYKNTLGTGLGLP